MNVVLTLLAVATGILLIVIVLRAMKHKRMNEFQAVAWLVGAVGIIILGIFPQIIPWVAGVLDVWWPPAVLIFFLLVLMFFIVFHHAQSISTLTAQLMELSMQVTLLKHENQKLKEKQKENEPPTPKK